MKFIKLISKHEFKALFPHRESECVPVKINGICGRYSYENGDECSMTLDWKDGDYSVDYTGHISTWDYCLLQSNLECEYLLNTTANDEILYLIPNKQEYGQDKQERAKHYVVTRGEYSDYRIVAVCSDRSVAEKIAERINREVTYEMCNIEEYEDGKPIDETLTAYFVNFEKGTVREDGIEYAVKGTHWDKKDGTIWGMYVFAKDEEHAMKIASDKRAMLMAQREGI